MRSRHWLAGCAIAVSALLATGCGGGGAGSGSATPAPSSLGTSMLTAIRQASSVHLSAVVSQGSQHITLDLSMSKTGGAAGTVAMGAAPFSILTTGGKTYLKLSASSLEFMHLPTSVCATFCTKWLLVPSGEAKSMDFSWASFVGSLSHGNPGQGGTVTGAATVKGQRAWVLKANDGSRIYVAASGPAYPLRVVAPGTQGHLDFTQWNSVTIPPPPPASKVVDISKLGG